MRRRIHSAVRRAMKFLQRAQVQPGVWAPLWFGNEHSASEENLVYGTSRVARALAEAIQAGYGGAEARFAHHHTAEWLAAAQNADGGWGGAPGTPSTVEETALAVEGLTSALRGSVAPPEKFESVLGRGVRWLVEAVESGESRRTSPIGFYFARLWYFERLYPLIFTVGALRAVSELRRENEKRQSQKDPQGSSSNETTHHIRQ
jgi:squalene-hopene/tetraprenyl-beta-curcumene cyclase